MTFVARTDPPRWRLALAPFWALAATFAFSVLPIAWAGAPVTSSLGRLFQGGFGSRYAWSETLALATPLVMTGLAVAVAFRARFYNLGVEGQWYAGALAAVAVGGTHAHAQWNLAPALAFPAVFAAAALAGALLLLLPAWLKTRFRVDEAVATLLLNFIVLLAVSLLIDGPLKDPAAVGRPQSAPLRPELELPRLAHPMHLSTGLLVALAAAGMADMLTRFTVLGFEMRVIGTNERAARFAGLPVARVTARTALVSGAIAGLGGAVEIAGRASHVTLDMARGCGYAGIVVALLAGLRPLAVVPSAVFVAGILIGAGSLSRTTGIPACLGDVIMAAALLSILTATLFARYRLRWR